MIGRVNQQETEIREERRRRRNPGQYTLERRLENLLTRVRHELTKPARRLADERLTYVLRDVERDGEKVEAALAELVQGRPAIVKPIAAAHPLTPGGADLLELVTDARNLVQGLISDRDAAGLEELQALRDRLNQALHAFGGDHAED